MKKKSSLPIAGFTLVEIMIVVAIIGLLSAIVIPHVQKMHRKAQQTVCITTLQQLRNVKSLWSLDNRTTGNACPVLADLLPYLEHGSDGAAPACPCDRENSFVTSYCINDLSTLPMCLIIPGEPGDKEAHRLTR